MVSKVLTHSRILLQGSDEALCDAVALGFSHEGGRSFDPQALDFALEIAGHVVGAMIVTQLQSTRYAGRDGSEAPMHPLAHRLQRLEAIGRTRGMNADDFRIGVFLCALSKLPKKSVVLAGAEFECFCTENLLVAHRPVMRKVADNGQLFAARLKQRSLRCQLLYAHSDPSQFGPT